MPKVMGARAARNHFSQILGEVHFGNEVVIIERSGKPMVAVISSDDYERLIAARDARFQVLNDIRQRVPDIVEEEVIQDVTDAIAAVRQQ